MATEQLHKLDAEVRPAYEAMPWIRLSADTVEPIRKAGGVSAAAGTPEGMETVEVNQDGVVSVIYRKKGSPPDNPVLVFFHGGGYVFGKPEMHAGLYWQFAASGITVVAVRYRLAPENSFPAANDDAVRAWEWLSSGKGAPLGLAPPPSKMALGGTSAGGGLAASTALRLRDTPSAVQPCGLILVIPWLAPPSAEPKPDQPSWHSVKVDKIWSLSNCLYAYSAVFPKGTSDPEQYAFPAEHPSLHNMPPTLISVSELDILRDSAIQFASRLMSESEAGAELHVYKGAWHGSSGAVPHAAISRSQDLNQVRFAKTVFGLA